MRRPLLTSVDSLSPWLPVLLLCSASQAVAQSAPDLGGLALEDLLQIKITTAARKPQSLGDTPAAVFVITREDIQRSGATSVPEALQMAPGVQVGRISSGTWAISLRGANGRFANKLQVLIDGRSVYSTLFSGTVWEDRDLMLEDVDRIEVVRGPGGALWGSNAMNGVINIITRRPQDTQGTLVSAGAGSELDWLAVRYGFQPGEGQSARIWGKRRVVDQSERPDGRIGYDGGYSSAGGFSWETRLPGGDTLALSGGVSSARHGEELDLTRFQFGTVPVPGRIETRENHLMARYAGNTAEGADYSLQASYAYAAFEIANPVGPIDDERNTLDIDFQRREARGEGRHDIVWGLGYRHTRDDLNVQLIGGAIQPPRRTITWTSLFVQDDITLLPERLNLVLGARVEGSSLARTELQPTARLMFTPEGAHSYWAAVSRTTRQPSRALRDFRADLGPFPLPAPLAGGWRVRSNGQGEDMRSETASTVELGYRYRQGALTLDAAAFATRYRRQAEYVVTFDGVVALPALTRVTELEVRTTDDSRAYGFELAADYRYSMDWSLHAAYTYTDSTALDRRFPTVLPLTSFFIYSADARHRLSLRSSWNLAADWQLDAWLRSVSSVEPSGIGGYTDADVRLAWQVRRDLELSVVGQNLLHARRAQYVADTLPSSPLAIQRAAYLKAVWSF